MKQSVFCCLLALTTLLLVGRVESFGAGPPNEDVVCQNLVPEGHGGAAAAQQGNGGYIIGTDLPLISAESGYRYTAGQTYRVMLRNTQSQTFRGFLVIAHVPGQNTMLLGQFLPQNSNQQTIDCDTVGAATQATITHRNAASTDFSQMNFMWQAPSGANGTVNFRYTVVQVFDTFYIAQDAALINSVPTAPVRAPEDYRLTFRTPSGCNVSDCTSFVGIDMNAGSGAYLDIYMEGEAQGWVGVGFSVTRNMLSADVIACNRDPANDVVEALDTYNRVDARTNGNDDTQNVVLFNSQFNGTRIYCTVAKPIAAFDPVPQDLNLNSDFFVMWGIRAADGVQGSLLPHSTNPRSDIPALSQTVFNPSTGVSVTAPVRAPEDYRLTFRTPSGCNISNCTSFVGIDVNAGNGAFLDIYMEGEAQGWVGVGFSVTRDMLSADVIACNRDPANDMVEALDTYNRVDARTNGNDDTQNVVLFDSQFDGTRIFCTVAKPIAAFDPVPQDLDLNSDFFVMWGIRAADGVQGSLMPHSTNPRSDIPALSQTVFNPSTGVSVTAPVRAPEDYRLTFRTPSGCNISNCTSFVGIDVNAGNGAFLDIYMEGEAQGWVGVGFSETRDMLSADVIACNRDPTNGMVEALDTYNRVDERTNGNDDTQNVVLFDSQFDGTRIFCTVAKLIAAFDPVPQDLDLNSNFFVMWGIRAADGVQGSLRPHSTDPPSDIPELSEALFNPVTGVMIQVQTPTRAPLDYRLRFRDPPGCDPSSCDIYVGIDTNSGSSDFLDIYIEGSSQGWVAVGFSDSRDMFAADVVGCGRDATTDEISVVDTWNTVTGRANLLDTDQNVIRFQSSFTDGRISCTAAKQIAAVDDQDLNLNAPEGLFVMYGVASGRSGAGALGPHPFGGGNPTLSAARFNPATAEGDGESSFPMGPLLRAHGIIMLIAWPLLAVSGIFFAAWMRPALPNGEWFQVELTFLREDKFQLKLRRREYYRFLVYMYICLVIHRAFLLASLFVGVLGFILAFIAHAQNPTPGLITLGADNPVGTTHYVFGIIVTLLQIINPLIAICRCNPGDKNRWIFNLIHGSAIGLLAEILALINIALGLSQFSTSSFFGDLTIFWVYIGYLIFVLVVIGVLFLIFTLLSLFSNDEDRAKTAPSLIKPFIGSSSESGKGGPPATEGVEMAVSGQKQADPVKSDAPAKPKVPSKDSPLRWGALTIFLAVNVILLLVLIILIALE